MSRRSFLVVCGIAACLMLTSCGEPSQPAAEEQVAGIADTTASPFLNVRRTDVAYVGSEACESCHGDLYAGYQTHGMAQSYYPMSSDVAVEDYSDATLYHEESDLWYEMFEENGRYYQREYRLDADGDSTHHLTREIEYVVGSGTAARTYLTESNNHFYEMPVTWYTQEERWDFSPGYEAHNDRFNRLIPDRCMSCHNSYPETVEFVEGKFTEVPNGIGCERCHGPGELHVEERLASPEAPDSIDYTIVNPAHLTLDRRLDVCQQCHLHGDVSLLREGEGPFSFRPSEPLSAHVAIFAAGASREAGEISVISHARRMKLSACFRGSMASGEPMECTTCHDPHEGFRTKGPEYFNVTCKNCHGVGELQATFDESEMQDVHSADANCFSCHMPSVEAEDAPHASFTDHWIRVVEEEPEVTALESTGEAPLVAYFDGGPEGAAARRYRGVAYVVHGLRSGDQDAFYEGIDLLEESLSEDPDYGNAQFMLGYARMQTGDMERAIPALERSVRIDPDIPERLNALAQAYEQTGGDPAAIERLYRRALAVQPDLADIRVNYGRWLDGRGRSAEAIAAYERAAAEKPWLAVAHYNLGSAYLQAGRLQAGEEALQRALKLNPDYAEALGNLGSLYAQRGSTQQARELFLRAVDAAPESPVAHGNLGSFYVNEGAASQAVPVLREAVALDPNYVTAHANLALAYYRTGALDQARAQAQHTLQIAPANQLARQILQATQ